MKTLREYFKLLLDRHSSISSKSFFLLIILLIAGGLLICIGFVLIWDVVHNGQVKSDLMGLSTLIGAISSLLGVGGATKVFGERNDPPNIDEDI